MVDPVDGTYNFVRGLTGWCSALALVEGDPSRLDAALLGAVHHPHDDTTWVGGPALPSTRDGVALDPVVDRTLDQACVATYRHPPTHATPGRPGLEPRPGAAATVRMLGSGSMDAALAAGGVVDVVVQHSVPDWDRLPGEALLRGVGASRASSRPRAGAGTSPALRARWPRSATAWPRRVPAPRRRAASLLPP